MPAAATQLQNLLFCLGAYTTGRFFFGGGEGDTWRVIKCFLFFCWLLTQSLLIKSIAQTAFIRKDQIYFSDIDTIKDVYFLVRNSRRTRRACHMVQEDG